MMNLKMYLVNSLFFVFTLLFCVSCEKEGHLYVNFINHSDIPVWVHTTSHTYIEGLENFQPILVNDYVEANEASELKPYGGFAWEDYLYAGQIFVVCVYSKSLKDKPKDEDYKEFERKYLLSKKWYTTEELDELNWTINYYKEENGDSE